MVNIDKMQLAFVPGRGTSTTDVIFIVCQLQEKYIAATKKQLYFASVDYEKAFDCVPRKVLWWPLRSLGVDKWAVHAPQGTYHNAQSCVRVNRVRWLVCVRALSLAHCFSSCCWKCCHVSPAQVCHGASLWRWPGTCRGHPGGVYIQAEGMEGWHGK